MPTSAAAGRSAAPWLSPLAVCMAEMYGVTFFFFPFVFLSTAAQSAFGQACPNHLPASCPFLHPSSDNRLGRSLGNHPRTAHPVVILGFP
jgi:hypothetical protein